MVGNLDAAREVWAQAPFVPDIGMNQYEVNDYFACEYRRAASKLKQRTPTFLYGVCLVQAYGLLEHYLTELLRDIVRSNPRVLLTSKGREDRKIDYRLVIDHLNSPGDLLDELLNRELLSLGRGSMKDFIKALRERFGLSALSTTFDTRISQLSLIRNCLVHNRGKASELLAEASLNFYNSGQQIDLDRNMVSRSITTFCSFASAVDRTATDTHFGNI